jgi:hypothetical protein
LVQGICGSSSSKQQGGSPSSAPATAPVETKVAVEVVETKKLDPKDFMLVKLEGQTIVREPG